MVGGRPSEWAVRAGTRRETGGASNVVDVNYQAEQDSG